MNTKTIHKYIRDEKNQVVGVVIAAPVKNKTEFAVGYSVIKPNSGDVFDVERGMQIALGRAVTSGTRAIRPIQSLNVAFEFAMMTARAARYFKGMNVETGTLARAKSEMSRLNQILSDDYAHLVSFQNHPSLDKSKYEQVSIKYAALATSYGEVTRSLSALSPASV